MLDLKRTVSVFIISSALLPTIAAQAATYYVAKAGSDAITCTQAQNIATPKLTLAAGVACLASGDTLTVRAGTYSNQTIQNAPSGTDSAYTVVRGYPGERPAITSSGGQSDGASFIGDWHHIEVRGFEFSNVKLCLRLYPSSHHIRFIDNICHDTFGAGILTTADTSDHVIRGNLFYRVGSGNPNYTVGINTIYGTGSRTIVENNVFHDIVAGIIIYTSGTPRPVQNDVIVRNNVLYNVGRDDLPGNEWMTLQTKGPAIGSYSPGSNRQIYNNIVYNSKFTAILANYGSDTSKFYNMVDNSFAFALFSGTGTGHEIKNNIAYQAGGIFIAPGRGTESNNLTTDPSFVDAAKGDFRLKSGSAAIDAGANVSQVTTDFSGVRRPQGARYDIGAYEAPLGSDGIPPLAPTSLTIK